MTDGDKPPTAHCATCICGRRAPVQGKYREPRRGPGTVAWSEHLAAHSVYAGSYREQDAEKIAERGGFGYDEITKLLGHEPTTWEPSRD